MQKIKDEHFTFTKDLTPGEEFNLAASFWKSFKKDAVKISAKSIFNKCLLVSMACVDKSILHHFLKQGLTKSFKGPQITPPWLHCGPLLLKGCI